MQEYVRVIDMLGDWEQNDAIGMARRGMLALDAIEKLAMDLSGYTLDEVPRFIAHLAKGCERVETIGSRESKDTMR